jgi:hypothetical protein
MNLPGVRSVISPPKGYKLGIFDLSGSHARIACQLSKAKLLIEIYVNDFDGHSIYASFFSKLAYEESVRLKGLGKEIPESLSKIITSFEGKEGWEPEDVKKLKKSNEWANALRNIAKTILYSSLNGGVKGTIKRSFISAGFNWFAEDTSDDRLATVASDKFTELYPELVEFCRSIVKKANATQHYFKNFQKLDGTLLNDEHGQIKALTGRHCYFIKKPGTRDWNKNKLEVPYTDALSSNWLMVEADILDDWVYHLQIEFDKNPHWGAYICNQVHDEVVVVFLEEFSQEVSTACLYWQLECFRRWVTIIPAIENGPAYKGLSKEDDDAIFYEWVKTPQVVGFDKKTETEILKAPWQMPICNDYSEK